MTLPANESADPNEERHPEMAEADAIPSGAGVPTSPEALIAMQSREGVPEGGASEHQPLTDKVREVLQRIEELDTSALEVQMLALALVRLLEEHHEQVMEGLLSNEGACHQQIMLWATDAERLTHCRMLLESVDLE
jgi:hypothetical protein